MMNKTLIYKLASLTLTAFFIALFIYVLPSILIILGSIILFLIVSSIVFTFLVKKQIIKTNFVYTKTNRENTENYEEIREMKDVTKSNEE